MISLASRVIPWLPINRGWLSYLFCWLRSCCNSSYSSFLLASQSLCVLSVQIVTPCYTRFRQKLAFDHFHVICIACRVINRFLWNIWRSNKTFYFRNRRKNLHLQTCSFIHRRKTADIKDKIRNFAWPVTRNPWLGRKVCPQNTTGSWINVTIWLFHYGILHSTKFRTSAMTIINIWDYN